MGELSLYFLGQEETITLPSGKQITIRETNGEDEEELSKVKNQKDGTYVLKFLTAVVTMDHSLKRKPTPEDIITWKQKDIYYTLFRTRKLSLGSTYHFKDICNNPNCADCKAEKVQAYEQDIEEYDSSDMFDKAYKPTQYGITPYPQLDAPTHEFIISSKKKLSFTLYNGELEREAASYPVEDDNKNSALFVRKLSIWDGEKWVRVFKFSMFSSREMAEIRNEVSNIDKLFEPIVTYNCPTCNKVYFRSLLASTDFFFPAEI